MADDVIKEFGEISKYKVRVIRSTKGEPQLDIREFIDVDGFCNFTRRGIRVNLKEFRSLSKDSQEILKIMEKPKKATNKSRKTEGK